MSKLLVAKLELPCKKSRALMELHLRAKGHHLPYGITQCCLSSDTSEHTPPSQTCQYSIYLHLSGFNSLWFCKVPMALPWYIIYSSVILC